MGEPNFTPGPWRLRTAGNIGNAIEAFCGRKGHDGDDGYRILASYNDATASNLYIDQAANRLANGHLIAAAPELYAQLEDARVTLAETAKILMQYSPSVAHNIVNGCAIRCGNVLAKARGETP